MNKDIEQIPEGLCRDLLLKTVYIDRTEKQNYLSNKEIEYAIKAAQEKGYIKKTKLAEAREYYQKIIESDATEYEYDLLECFRRLHNKYEEAIEEINQSLDK